MKVGDLVRQKSTGPRGTVPSGALGVVLEQDDTQTYPRWTIRWIAGNEVMPGHIVSETVGYGHNIEVISEAG